MYAKSKRLKKQAVSHQCQNCDEIFQSKERAQRCPSCLSQDRSNLIVLHMEDDEDRVVWLELVDFAAGD